MLYENINKSIYIQMTVISQTAARKCVSVFERQGREKIGHRQTIKELGCCLYTLGNYTKAKWQRV